MNTNPIILVVGATRKESIHIKNALWIGNMRPFPWMR